MVAPLAGCRLHAPVRRPGKAIAVGRNDAEHLEEMGNVLPHAVPASWIKATSAIIGPVRDIVKSRMMRRLDYETELAVVIGTRCKDVPEPRALEVVAGYTIMSDITAVTSFAPSARRATSSWARCSTASRRSGRGW